LSANQQSDIEKEDEQQIGVVVEHDHVQKRDQAQNALFYSGELD